jgi:hypothetical protein
MRFHDQIQCTQAFDVTMLVEAPSPDEAWNVLVGDNVGNGRVVSTIDQQPGEIISSRKDSFITEDER